MLHAQGGSITFNDAGGKKNLIGLITKRSNKKYLRQSGFDGKGVV
jgi:hypothetical protein